MKKVTLPILIILNLFFHCSFAQNKANDSLQKKNITDTSIVKKDTIVKFRRWSIGISGSPDYSYRVLKKSNDPPWGRDLYVLNDIDSMNYVEKPTYSWTFGIPITYHFKKHISIASGIYFSNKTFESKGFAYYTSTFNETYHIYKQENVDKQDFIFFEIPFALEYNFRPKKLKRFTFSIMAGGTFCTNLSSRDYNSRRFWWGFNANLGIQMNNDKFHARQYDYRYLGYTYGLKATYQLSRRFIIGIEPVYKFYFKEYFVADYTREIEEHPYSYGINISLEFMK